MISVLGQQLWKNKLVSGALTIVLGVMALAWPGPTILVASTMFGLYLLASGFAELFLAFTLPRSAATRVLLFLHRDHWSHQRAEPPRDYCPRGR